MLISAVGVELEDALCLFIRCGLGVYHFLVNLVFPVEDVGVEVDLLLVGQSFDALLKILLFLFITFFVFLFGIFHVFLLQLVLAHLLHLLSFFVGMHFTADDKACH